MKEYFGGLVRTSSNVWEKVDKNTFNNSIVFIEDTKKIYSNGVYYNNDFECEKVLFETENITLRPNKFYYNPNAISSLDISLDFEEGVVNTYFVEFGGTNISLLLPSYIRWENDIIPDFSKSYYKYTVKIQDDVAYVIDKIFDESLIPNYFYIESLENSNNINLGNGTWLYAKNSRVEYSIDKINWNPLNITSYTLNKGGKMYFRCVEGNIEKNSSNSNSLLYTSKKINVGGDISTVIYGEENVQTINNEYAMRYLFYNTKMVDASKLLLPATTLAKSCYQYMFCGCASLTTAPELPATTLADYCYSSMFNGCTSLIVTPELPATTLNYKCYYRMFYNCTSLTVAPELPATTLDTFCYNEMFTGCTSLTVAPELPATELTNYCYSDMFSRCTSLTTAPELPATTLAGHCYAYMFQNCTSLTAAPELPAMTLADYCYCRMFYGCSDLNYIKCLATNIPDTSCTLNWLNGVSNTGTFVKHPNMNNWSTDDRGIPKGWEVVNAETS